MLRCAPNVCVTWSVQVTPDEVFRANALGWCIEWVRPLPTPRCIRRMPQGRFGYNGVCNMPWRSMRLYGQRGTTALTPSYTARAVASILPGGGRHHGQLHHAEGAALLVPRARGASLAKRSQACRAAWRPACTCRVVEQAAAAMASPPLYFVATLAGSRPAHACRVLATRSRAGR